LKVMIIQKFPRYWEFLNRLQNRSIREQKIN